MSEMESTKSPTDIFCKYLLIKQDKEKGEFLCSVIFFCPPKKFLVNEGNLRTFIQKAKYKKKNQTIKCFQTSVLENLWQVSCADPVVYQVLSCEV